MPLTWLANRRQSTSGSYLTCVSPSKNSLSATWTFVTGLFNNGLYGVHEFFAGPIDHALFPQVRSDRICMTKRFIVVLIDQTILVDLTNFDCARFA